MSDARGTRRRGPVRKAGGPQARYLLVGAALFLLALGLVMVYSASMVADLARSRPDAAYHMKKQLLFILIGAAVMLGAQRLDYRALKRLAWPAWWVSLAGLVLVFIIGRGTSGAVRWITVGPVDIQPSEYAKLSCLLVGAMLMTEWRRGRLDDVQLLGRLAACLVPVVLLVMKQPDMGTTMSIAVSFFFVVWLGGLRLRHVAAAMVLGAAFVTVAILADAERTARFTSFLDPWRDPRGEGYQVVQGLLAFGSGGIAGVGLGLSRQKYFYLPAAHTDFIFAIIGEELGLAGTLAIVCAFGVLAYAGFRIALGTKDAFGRLVAAGVTAMIVVQAAMNMAAVTGLMPVTGIPLPLVSYGGSSITFTMLCLGLILSVSERGARVRHVPHARSEGGHEVAGAGERGRDRGSRVPRAGAGRAASRRRA